MFRECPVPATRKPHTLLALLSRHSSLALLALLMALAAVPPRSRAQSPYISGRWSQISQSLDSAGVASTAIHMALLRGDEDWESNATHFHSYLFWWENRHELCGNTSLFNGALYGWRPDSAQDADCSGSMMASGFKRLPLNSSLDPGYDVFCAAHTSSGGKLVVAGGAAAENSGVQEVSLFDVHATGGNYWTRLSDMAQPRWYPTLRQLSDNSVIVYSGLRYARMHVVGGRPDASSNARSPVGRMRLTASGEWDDEIVPAADTGLVAPGGRPTPRVFGTAPIYKVNSGLSRAVLFGGKDSTSIGNGMQSDVWWLQHRTNGGSDELAWWKFTSSSGTGPSLGLWKHAAVADTATRHQASHSRLWIVGGVDGAGDANPYVYSGEQDTAQTSGRRWSWVQHAPPSGPDNPGARINASYAYDVRFNRMIVYGGYDDAGDVANNEVYALRLNATNPTWKKLTHTTSASNDRPVGLAEAALAEGPSDAEHLDGPSANMYLYGGIDEESIVRADVWLMYFPTDSTVSWFRLPRDDGGDGPSPRRGAIAIRDHDSWNLRIYGGLTADLAAPDTCWMIDIYRNSALSGCDQRERQWVVQGLAGRGAVGAVGFPDPFEIPANTVEHMTPPPVGTGQWSNIPNSPDRYQHFYPLLFTLPNGKIFDATATLSGRPTFTLDLSTGAWSQFPTTATPTALADLEGGSAVSRVLRDRTYEVMKCGSKDLQSGIATGLTGRIQIAPDGSTAGWRYASRMAGRVFHNLVTMPDGKVFVTGGARLVNSAAGSDNDWPVYRPQIWNPSDTSWTDTTVLARESPARGYHSTALLMPDGRILTGGGNDAVAGLDKHKFAVFCPPYRFTTSGVATAPVINGAPAVVAFNTTFGVETSWDVARMCLIRPGAVTHGFNQDQHYIELEFTPCNCGYTALAPTAAYAPPGDYLLFIVNSAGVPSVGRWIQLAASNPSANSSCFDYCNGGGSGGGEDDGGGFITPGAHRGSGGFTAGPVAAAAARYRDNTLFAGSADGSIVHDRLALPAGPVMTESGVRVRLRHSGPGSDEYSRIRLVAVDHEASIEAAPDTAGECFGTRAQASAMSLENGRDVLADMARSGTADGQSGDVMTAQLGANGTGELWIEASGRVPGEGGIRIEAEQGGVWNELAVLTPRERPSVSLVRGVSSARVRLVFLGAHRVYGLGWFQRSASAAHRRELAPVAITHSTAGVLAADTSVTLAHADTAWVDFATPEPAGAGLTRDWFLEVDGRPLGYKPSASQLAARHLSRPEGRPVAGAPLEFAFTGAVPNPFTASTRLVFELPAVANVKVEIFDTQGRRVYRLEQRFEAGRQSFDWNRRDARGLTAAPGVYQVRLRAGANVATRSVVVLP